MKRATKISIIAKCSDMFGAQVLDANDKLLYDYDGYVPFWFPEAHYGDYVMLTIDLKTGKILNWKSPSYETLCAWMNKVGGE